MSIEEIVLQGGNVNFDMVDVLMRNLLRVIPVLRKRLPRFEDMQRPHQIPLSHVQVLHAISCDGPMSMTALSERLDIAKPNISPIIERMVSKGFVTRKKSELDRRIIMIDLTRQGAILLSAIEGSFYVNVGKWALRFSESELSELNDNLETFVRILG